MPLSSWPIDDRSRPGSPAMSEPATSGPPQALQPMSTTGIVPQFNSQGLAMASPYMQAPSGSGGLFSGARDFIINNPIMVEFEGEDKIRYSMGLLLKYIIDGAAHDDSSRQYSPRCHPGTREAILELLLTWFHDIFRLNSLFLLTGPAGVGKSAIMQTFAEEIGDSVVSVFVSRPNNCNGPNRILVTIANQFAHRIKAYRDYIVDQIANNPGILTKNMEAQFRSFIIEPFVVRKIGAGGPPMAIVLDGLDEVEGVDPQRDIIRIISKFTQEHRDTPLVWIIASRPELHITNTFKEASIQGQFESHSIFIDDPDARDDVLHFLADSFHTIREEYPGPTSDDWPGEGVLAKLADASSGHFIFAQTAIRFIKDPDHSNPTSRLDRVLSAIDGSKKVLSAEQPFRNLDNLYREILLRIPPELLPITKLLLGLALSFRSDTTFELCASSGSRTLRGMAVILQLEPHQVYPALTKCISTLEIPPWEEAHITPLTFLHASFPEYLTDVQRSGEFYIDVHDVEIGVLSGYLTLWYKHFGEKTASGTVSFKNDIQGIPEEDAVAFTRGILTDMGRTILDQIVKRHEARGGVSSESQRKRNKFLNSLRNVNMIRLCDYNHGPLSQWDASRILFSFVERAFETWVEYPDKAGNSDMFKMVHFKDLNVNYDNDENYMVVKPIDFHDFFYLFPIDHQTKLFLQESPDLPVLICGTVSNSQVALLAGNTNGRKYCIFSNYNRIRQNRENQTIETVPYNDEGIWADLL